MTYSVALQVLQDGLESKAALGDWQQKASSGSYTRRSRWTSSCVCVCVWVSCEQMPKARFASPMLLPTCACGSTNAVAKAKELLHLLWLVVLGALEDVGLWAVCEAQLMDVHHGAKRDKANECCLWQQVQALWGAKQATNGVVVSTRRLSPGMGYNSGAWRSQGRYLLQRVLQLIQLVVVHARVDDKHEHGRSSRLGGQLVLQSCKLFVHTQKQGEQGIGDVMSCIARGVVAAS